MNHAGAKVLNSNRVWDVMGFYGDPMRASRATSWKLLDHILATYSPVVLVFGNFNVILGDDKKLGGAKWNPNQLTGITNIFAKWGLLS